MINTSIAIRQAFSIYQLIRISSLGFRSALLHTFSFLFRMVVCVLPFLFFASCESYETEQITLEPKKTAEYIHLGKGIWTKYPKGYSKADTYDGYQAPGQASSISIMTNQEPIQSLWEKHNPSDLNQQDVKLLQLSPVKYGVNDNALFSIVHDTRKNTIRYLLAFHENGITYNVKAFCFNQVRSTYEPTIKNTMLSAVLAEVEEKEELFKMATLKDAQTVVFTRDGKYPTASEDQATIEIKTIKAASLSPGTDEVSAELIRITKDKHDYVEVENLLNGKFFSGTSRGQEKNAFVALLTDTASGGAVRISCYGNKESNLQEFETYVRAKYLKLTIDPRK
jgi:hypothetical protein